MKEIYMKPLNPDSTLPYAIAHLVGLELQDEKSRWHTQFPATIKLAERYRVSQRTVLSALAILETRGLTVKRGGRYFSSCQSNKPANRLVALAATLAAAINDGTLTGLLPMQRELAHRHNTHGPMVSKAITILVQQGYINSDHRTVATHPPTAFISPEPVKHPRRSGGPRRSYRKAHEQHTFSPLQLIINGIVHEHPTGLEHAGIHAASDIAERYKLSDDIAGDVYFGVLQRYR